ncbi:ornithine carbamoyltransferase [Cellvibrio polysaccharolyticus]|uniref:Ornithine carbamoyltransferase n=1 Tax=Cellvibrio polysaccharolyticus TaxID=2082724 RepID=A0A928YT92_9GAMM|nr:ornithine carbamoyltransferase [Cellvibrio polysaccharolyticus]MBE8717311.1 ornithine carbamoyltransferase [Cellvibrio polysaccharolyticus]
MVPPKAPRHFLTLNDVSRDELHQIIQRAIELKSLQRKGQSTELLKNKVLGMIFEKSSTRTRISFESGMAQAGGHAIFLSNKDSQLGRGETIEDSARCISRMVDIVMIRTFAHSTIQRFADNSIVPVINGLTDDYHPCQLLADIQTFVEQRGSLDGKVVAWVGDGNNMCQTYIQAAELCNFELRIACPKGFTPRAEHVENYRHRIKLSANPRDAVAGADLVVTDTWASMGQEDQKKEREQVFGAYQVNSELMSHANKGALFMHCLPAYRGKEVSAELLDNPEAIVWEEAENRLHAQKALVEFLLTH